MALFGDPTHDRRVQLEASSLHQAGYQVTLATVRPVEGPNDLLAGIRVISWQPQAAQALPGAWAKRHTEDRQAGKWAVRGGRISWLAAYMRNVRSWGRWAVREVGTPAAWHAHDLTGLAALALGGMGHVPVVYDSHELYLESGSAERMPKVARSILALAERRWARNAGATITVNAPIATELARRYGVEPVVVMNCPPLKPIPSPGVLRTKFSLGHRPILLSHGAVDPDRGIERIIDVLAGLPKEVVLVILGDGLLVPWVTEQARRTDLADRLYWHPAVPVDDLMSWVVDADIGVILSQPTTLNMRLSAPNRLFDYLAAGVPIVASDFPELRRIVLGEGVGAVCDPTDALSVVASITALLDEPKRLAAMASQGRLAHERTYNWQEQARAMIATYAELLA